MQETIDYIQQALTLPDFDALPAQLALAPRPRPLRRPAEKEGHARLAAVMAMLYCKWELLHLVLVKRPGTLRTHSGQVSFPGGRKEEGESFEQAALRETCEEIGIRPRHIQVLGQLSQIYIPPSDFEVHPFVGIHIEEPKFKPSAAEVEAILEVPITHFEESINRSEGDETLPYPHFLVGGYRVWGATAVMISELVARLGFVRSQVDGP